MNLMTPSEALRRITRGAPTYPLGVLFGLSAVDQLDRVAFSVLLPDIRDTFQLDLGTVLGLVALITPASILVGIPIAYWADRTSRVRLAAAGAVLWAVFSIATGFALNVWHLVIARVGSGLAKATNDPTHNSLLADYYAVGVRPGVYAFHQAALNVGQFLSPLIAGLLGYYFTWRVPFWIFAVPTFILVAFALRLREPPRGIQDRLALGVDEVEAAVEESPPSFAEATRLLYNVRSLRRIMVALPFIGASAFGLGSLLALFLADVYGLNSAQRGAVTAAAEPFAIIGLAVGAPIAQRLLARDPARVLQFLGVVAVGVAGAIVMLALSPNLPVAVAAMFFQALVGAFLTPGIFSVFSVVIPARARSLGFVYASLWLLPGVLVLPVIGRIGDAYGLRAAIVVLAPLYLIGFLLLASAGKFLESDIHATRVGSMAEHEIRRALAEGEPKLLMVRGLEVAYDQVQVLFGVDFDLKAGEVVALLGTNGAGKSTVLRAISGLVDPVGGAIYFDGTDITHMDPVKTSGLGLVQMPGGRAIFPTLAVEDHFELAAWTMADEPERVRTATAEILEIFPQLRTRWKQPAGNLSGGEQQMLGLAMSLVAKPRLLMIDELSLGLAPAVIEQLLAVLRRVNAEGTAIILVEQSVNIALTVADRAYFLEKGEVRFAGPTADLLDRGDILRAVFLNQSAKNGARAGVARTRRRTAPAVVDKPNVLEVADVYKSFGGVAAVNGVSLSVAPGEIVGLIGANGAGKTTLFDLISGFLTPDEGRISFLGNDVTQWSPDRRARLGLGRSFQDARLFPSLTVAENLAVSLERHLKIRDYLADAIRLPAVEEQELDVKDTVEALIALMNLGAFRDKFVSELSTGSRRMVDLAMAIAHQPRVLVLDEPSAGIAQRESEALAPLIMRIRDELDCSVLVIEHDMAVVTTVADRMLALELGRVIAEGSPRDVTRDSAVVRSYLGGDVATVYRSGARRKTRKVQRPAGSASKQGRQRGSN